MNCRNRESLRAGPVVRPTGTLPVHGTKCRDVENRQHSNPIRLAAIHIGCPLLALLLLLHPASGEIIDSFESARTTWKLVEQDCSATIVAHHRSNQLPHTGKFCETFQFQAGSGTLAYLAHPIPPARVLPGFSPSVWVKSNRPGIRLMALVVFPHEPAPNGEGFVQRLIPGPSYTRTGQWERLSFADLPDSFETLYHRVVQATRIASSSERFDTRDAYISAVVLNAYGGRGANAVWIDDLEAEQLVAAGTHDPESGIRQVAWQEPAGGSGPIDDPWRSTGRTSTPYKSQSQVIADDRPLMIKMVQHHGEPFEFLRNLGFNTIALPTAPTPAVNQEATRLGLWLVAPPPPGFRALGDDRNFTRVLAWTIAREADLRSLPAARNLAQGIRTSPATLGRMTHATIDWTSTRLASEADLIELTVTGELGWEAGTSVYDLTTQTLAKSPVGTPLIASLPIDPSPDLVRQVAALAGRVPDLATTPDHAKSALFQALAAGARGISIETHSRLDGLDEASQRRADLAVWLNQWLDRLEPWVAAGVTAGELATSRPDFKAFVLKTERSELILVVERPELRNGNEQRELSIVDRDGTPAARAFRITPDGTTPLIQHRQRGVTSVLLPHRDTAEAFVISEDPLAVQHLMRTAQTQQLIDQALEVQQDLVLSWLTKQSTVNDELALYRVASPRSSEDFLEAMQTSRVAEQQRNSRSYGAAFEALLDTRRLLHNARSILHDNATAPFPQPNASPLCLDVTSLPDHWDLSLRLRNTPWQGSMLAAGDFEDLGHMIGSGWTNHRWAAESDNVQIELIDNQFKTGRRSLHLHASHPPLPPPSLAALPTFKIESAPVNVEANQVVRIHGWFKTAPHGNDALPQLQVSETLGGKDMGVWLKARPGQWTEFTLYRGSMDTRSMRLNFQVQGYGDVWLDDVTVHVAQPAGRAIGNRSQARMPQSNGDRR